MKTYVFVLPYSYGDAIGILSFSSVRCMQNLRLRTFEMEKYESSNTEGDLREWVENKQAIIAYKRKVTNE